MKTNLFFSPFKRFFLISFLGGSLLSAGAQTPSIAWQSSSNGSPNAMIPTFDGGYIAVGSTQDNTFPGYHAGNDFWVIKTDANGSLLWQKCYGGSGSDIGYAIRQTADSGYVFCGQTYSNDGDISGGHGDADLALLKIDGNGTLLWQTSLGGSAAENMYPNSFRTTADGGFILAGTSTSSDGNLTLNQGSNDVWVVKLSASGSLQWQQSYGSTAADQAYDIQETNDGGYIVAAGTAATADNGDITGVKGGGDYWILKLATTGTLQWQKIAGGTLADMARSVLQASNGDYVVAGISKSTDGDITAPMGGGKDDVWIIRLSTSGTLLQEKSIGGTKDDRGYAIEQTLDGGFLVGAGSISVDGALTNTGVRSGQDFWIFKTDANLNLQWGSVLTPILGNNYIYSVHQNRDGSYILAGNGGQQTGIGHVLAKLDACPYYTWLEQTICPGTSFSFGGQLLSSSGTYRDTLLRSNGCDSIVTLQLQVPALIISQVQASICQGNNYTFGNQTYSLSGTYTHTLSSAISGCDSLVELQLTVMALPTPSISASGNVLSTGSYISYQWYLNGAPINGATAQNYTALQDGNYQVEVNDQNCGGISSNYFHSPVGIDEATTAATILVFPNPARDVVYIRSAPETQLYELRLQDMNGREMQRLVDPVGHEARLDLSEMARGLYILRIRTEQGTHTVKIIKD